MKNTRKLSPEGYERFKLYDSREDIKKLVNIEATRRCQIKGEKFTPPPEIPKYAPSPVEKEKVGWYVFFATALKELTP